MSRRIAVALDFSREAEYACEWTLKNFYRPDDTLDLINCDDNTALSDRLGLTTIAESEYNAAKATRKIEDLADRLESKKACDRINLVDLTASKDVANSPNFTIDSLHCPFHEGRPQGIDCNSH